MSSDNTKRASEDSGDGKNDTNKLKSNFKPLPEKTFQLRNSLLTDLFETDPHVKTVYHIFLTIWFSLLINTMVHDYLETGEFDVGFRLICAGFGKIHIALLAWMVFFSTSCLCYYSFTIWAMGRINLFPKSTNVKVWDITWLVLLIAYYVLVFKMAASTVSFFQLPLVSAALFLIEQVRMLMKIHSFVRSNGPKVLNYKPRSESELNISSFSKFLYFFFAPTLIYRDEYPRSPRIRKNFLLYRFLEMIAVAIFYGCLLKRFFFPYYRNFGHRKFTWSEIIISIFENATVGLILKICGFFLILHSTQNFFAELLRFGDRLFYKNWWMSCSFAEYFRTWNDVVGDWLYCYVYKDMYEVITPGNKTLSKVMVFVVSAVVHEWILINVFGFFLPVMFLFFLLGGVMGSLVSVSKRTMFRRENTPTATRSNSQWTPSSKGTVLNILFWYCLYIGSGILSSLYTLEYFARANVPTSDSSWTSYLLPRWLTCDCIG